MTEKKSLLPINLQLFAEGKETEVTEPTVETTEVTEVTEEVVPETQEPTVIVKDSEQSESKVAELEAKITELIQENAELKQKLSEQEGKVTELTETLTAQTEVAGTKATEMEIYQKSLEEIVAEKEKGISDEVKALMPEGIAVTEKLAWLNKAEALKPKEEVVEQPILTIGQPTPVTTEVIDQADVSPTQRMSNFFNDFFGNTK